MNREDVTTNKIKMASNLFILFLIFEKIIEKVGFWGRVEVEGTLKDIIVFSVFLANIIVISVFFKKDNEYVDKKNKKKLIANFILMMIYLELSYYNSDNVLLMRISTFLIVVITESICYIFSMKVKLSKYIIYIVIMGIVGIEFITGFHIYASLDKYDTEKTYEFESTFIYEKYKALHEETEAYVILDYSKDSVYVRELVENNTHFFTFDNQEEFKNFIDNQTMGKNIDVPVLSYDLEFDDKKLTATYFEEYQSNTTDNMSKNGIVYFFAFGCWYVISSIIGEIGRAHV